MLTIKIPITAESFDDEKQEFIPADTVNVVLEHSLISLSKWESIWEKPFLSNTSLTDQETLSYIECMIVSEDLPPELFSHLTNTNIEAINAYIDAKMTATVVSTLPVPSTPSAPNSRKEIITSELLYYWMIKMSIPFNCENWHLNRLLMLIQVYEAKEAPAKKLSKQELAARNRAENERRRAAHKTKG